MSTTKFNPRLIFIISIIVFGAIMRLIPHWPNFTPIAAMALFGGAYFRNKHLAFVIPFAAMFVSDLILGLHQLMLAVYASFAIVVLIGIILRNRVKFGNVLLASLISSTLFFVITNFAVWLNSPIYPQNYAGLLTCYTAAIPFFNNGILGDLFFTALFFGGFYFAQLRFPALAEVEK